MTTGDESSVFSQLLYSININEFKNSTSVFDLIMYADDTTLFCILDTVLEANIDLVLNNELDNS